MASKRRNHFSIPKSGIPWCIYLLLNEFILFTSDRSKSYWEYYLYKKVLFNKINTCGSMKRFHLVYALLMNRFSIFDMYEYCLNRYNFFYGFVSIGFVKKFIRTFKNVGNALMKDLKNTKSNIFILISWYIILVIDSSMLIGEEAFLFLGNWMYIIIFLNIWKLTIKVQFFYLIFNKLDMYIYYTGTYSYF